MYGKPGNFGVNSNGTAHPSENFLEKRNTFRGTTFFPFLPKRPKFSVPLVWITSAMQALCPEKAKTLPVFCKWYNPIPFLFSVSKTYQYHLTEIFHRNFRANGKRSWTSGVPPRKFYTRHKIEALVWKVSRKRKSWTSDKTTFFIKQINKCEEDVGFPKPCSQCSHQQILQICVRSEWTTSEWKKNLENTRKKNFIKKEKAQCAPWSIGEQTALSFFLKVQQTSFFFKFSNSVTRLWFSSFNISSSCCKYSSTQLSEGMSLALDISDKKAEQIAARCHHFAVYVTEWQRN